MKIFTSMIVLGALCLLETNQPAQAIGEKIISPNFHLVRGGRGGERGFEGRGESSDVGNRDVGNRNAGTNDSHNVATDHPAVPEDRTHTLDDANTSRLDNLNKDEGWGDGEWGGGCSAVDANGNCTSYGSNVISPN